MAKLSPIFNEPWLDANGDPYSGAQLFTYAAGSSTKQNTYKDNGSAVAHANPIILNSRGIADDLIWLTSGETYKFVLAPVGDTDPPAAAIDTFDDIEGINDTSVTIDQWVSGPAPTYIGATSFSLVGDQTTEFHVGRRLKTTNTGGTVYSTIIASAYTSLTTITVVNDSGSLDSGLSAVSYGLISQDNSSVPGYGVWITPDFSAGDYTGSGSMTVTVASGDVAAYDYSISGKTMFISVELNTITIGGTLSNTVNIAIPASKTATKLMRANAVTLSDNGTVVDADCSVSAAGTVIQVSKADLSNFTASTNNTVIRFQMFFEID